MFRRLEVWQKGLQLTTAVYAATTNFPPHELYGLAAQMRAAAVSIPSNIAEGRGRSTQADFRQFVVRARGSAYELETQIAIAAELHYLDREISGRLECLCGETIRLVNGLIRHLSRSPPAARRSPTA